ncbi:MAG: hypothetical protein V2J89_03750, partial [Halieaceae bacterium]|nr:hypothetical protein [Halieaceae bacterium]
QVDFNYSDPVDPGGTFSQLDNGLRLQINPVDQPVVAQGISQISLPSSTFIHDDPFAGVSVEATLADGSALPDYISFNPNTQSFAVDGEAAFMEGVTGVDVLLVATDDRGQTATGSFRIEVIDEAAAINAGLASDDDGGTDDVAPAAAGSARPGDDSGDAGEGVQLAGDAEADSPVADSQEQLIRLTVNLDSQRVLAEGGATIALPANTFEHSNPDEELFVEATLIDGSALPSYVVFDADAMTFLIDGEAAAAAGQTEITILLVGYDAAGNSASGVFVVQVESLEDAIAGSEGDADAVSENAELSGDAVPLDADAAVNEQDASGNEEADGQDAATEEEQQAKIRENLDSQLEKASRYTFVDKLEQLLDDIKNLFT